MSRYAFAALLFCSALQAQSLPVDFLEDQGRFFARGAVLEKNAITLRDVSLVFENARRDARPVGADRRGTYNFYISNDASRWRSGVPGYARVVYPALYPNIDLVVRDDSGRLEYDLLLSPGANLSAVSIKAEGFSELEIEEDGSLLLHRSPVNGHRSPVRQTAPRTWEVLPDGLKRPLPSRFGIINKTTYGFEVPDRDPNLPLVIDPGIEWSTFLGGSSSDFLARAIPAKDGSGDVFVGGTTNSVDFPLLDDPTFSELWQNRAFIARLSADGTQIKYATFLGGWHSNLVWRGIDVDAGGNAVLVGQTYSPDFPTTAGAVDRVGQNKDGFVFRVNPTGALIFSTFLGGLFEDFASAVAYDPAGNVIIGGSTASDDFPTTPTAYDPTYNFPNAAADGGAHGDMFVTRLNPTGTQITYSTFIGGPSTDVLEHLVVDVNGFVTVGGWVTGNNIQVFVPTPDAFDSTWNGSQDAAIARLKLDGAGSADLKYATLIGGASQDNIWSVALDPTNPELVTFAGRTWSNNYPTTPGVVKPDNPPFSELFPEVEAGIITRFRFSAAGNSLVWSTHHHAASITSVTVNAAGEPIVTGTSLPWDIATTRGAAQRVARGSGPRADSFVSRLSSTASQYLYQSFFGGSYGGEGDNYDTSPQVAHLSGNTVILSGQTSASDYPITPLAADSTSSNASGASNEGFITKFTLEPDASGDLTATAPTLISPPDGVTFNKGNLARIEWSAVTDPAGIEAYEFEVATRSDFHKDWLLHRGGVTDTWALIPPSDGSSGGLPQQSNIYWRVRTVDKAGNLSDWSTTRSFLINPDTGRLTVSAVQMFPGVTIEGGKQADGMVHLYDPAPAGGVLVKLSAHHGRGQGWDRIRTLPLPISIPESVTVPEGALTAPFTINTEPVSETLPVTVVATTAGIGNQGHVSVAVPEGPQPASVTVVPSTVTGGKSATGTVFIDQPAPAGGTVVNLYSSHPAVASFPSSVTVPAGESKADFAISTFPVTFEVDVTIRATSHGGRYLRPFYVRPANLPTLTSMSISPKSVSGGSNSGGTLTFSGPIPLGEWPGLPDNVVRFTSSDPQVAAAFPGDEYVLAGSTSHTFGIYTTGVPAARDVTITAWYDGTTLSDVITVGAVTGVTVSQVTSNVTDVYGGEGGIITVHLAAPPPANVLLTISTTHPSLFTQFAKTLIINSGSTSGSFAFITSKTATAPTTVTVTATYGNSSSSLDLTVRPPRSANPPVVEVTVSPTSVNGGTPSTGTVRLKSVAAEGGAVVQLVSSDTSAATVPDTVTVAAGATTAPFTVTTKSVTSDKTVVISALLHLTASTSLRVKSTAPPPPPGTPSLLSPAEDAKPAQPVTFDWTDASNAAKYTIQIDDEDRFSSPHVVNKDVVPSQDTIGNLPARRLWWRVRAINSAGAAGNWSSVRRFEPQSAPAPASLSSITVNPSSVVGGNNSEGTATLTSGAPSGGALVTLSSSNPSVASCPPSVTVPAGQTSAKFTITTTSVNTSTDVTITGSYNGTNRNAILTVTPPAPPPPPGPLPAPSLIAPPNDARFPPGASITFDWSDVSGAANYTIQIDDDDRFASPIMRQETVTSSTYTTNTLPTRTMWWRVRANSSSGTAGNWSSVRRVEMKD